MKKDLLVIGALAVFGLPVLLSVSSQVAEAARTKQTAKEAPAAMKEVAVEKKGGEAMVARRPNKEIKEKEKEKMRALKKE